MARSSTFTTYINAVDDGREEQLFNRLEQRATKTYDSITRAAERATRAAAGLTGGRGTAGLGAQQRGFTAQLNATRAVERATAAATGATERNTRATTAQGLAAEGASRRNNQLASSLRSAGTSLSIVQGPLGGLAGRITTVASALEQLTGFQLGLAGVGAGLFALGRSANSFAEIEGRLRPLYETQQQVNRAFDDVAGIAQRSRSALEPVVDLYVKLQNASEQFGLSSDRVSRFVEQTAKLSTLSGGAPESRRAGLFQFGQAVGGNFATGGAELNSVIEQNFALAKAIADGFETASGKIGVTTSELKKLAAEGGVTTLKVVEALERQAAKTDEKFARLPQTLGVSLTELQNSILITIGRFDQMAGGTRSVAAAISLIAQNMNGLISLALGVGAAFAAIRLPAALAVGVATLTKSLASISTAPRNVANTLAAVAAQQKNATTARLAQLGAEKRAIDAQVTSLKAQQLQLQRTADSLVGRRGGLGVASLKGEVVGLSRVQQELATTTRALSAAQATQARVTYQVAGAVNTAAVASTRYAAASANATARSSILRNVFSGILGVLNPYAIAVGGITTLLYLYATAASAAERSTRTFTAEQKAAYDQIGKTTEALERQTDAALRNARAKQTSANTDSFTELSQSRTSFSSQLRIAAEDVGGSAGKELAQLGRLAEQGGKLYDIYAKFDDLRRRTPALQGRGLVGTLGGAGKSARLVDEAFDDVQRAAFAARANADNTRRIDAEFERRAAPVTPQPRAGGTRPPVTNAAVLKAQTEADALTQAGDTIEAANKRYQAALKQLDLQFVKNGQVAPEKTAEYSQRIAQLRQQNEAEVATIKAGAKAQADARRQARTAATRGAQIAERNQLDEAEDRANASLIALETKKATLSQEEYNRSKLEILRLLDEERNRINETGAASNQANREALRQARELQRVSERNAERRGGIVDRYADEPRAIVKAKADVEELRKLIGQTVGGIEYTTARFAQDVSTIQEGLRRPFTEITRELEQQAQVQDLLLQGRESEARALDRALQLNNTNHSVTQEDYETLVRLTAEEDRRNRAIERRGRLVSAIEGAVDDVRQGLEDLIVEFPRRGPKVATDFLKTMVDRVQRVNAKLFVDRLLGDTDERVRELLSGKAAVEGRTRFFAGKLSESGAAAGQHASALVAATEKIAAVTSRLVAEPIGADSADPLGIAPAINDALKLTNQASQVIAGDIVVSGSRSGSPIKDPGDIAAATASRVAYDLFSIKPRLPDEKRSRQPLSISEAFDVAGSAFGQQLDRIFGSGTFFKRIGGSFGTALEGAGNGALASGVARAVGIKQSALGSQIGGGIGGVVGKELASGPLGKVLGETAKFLGPLGGIVGGLLGGTLGGLLKKTKTGSATVGGGAGGLDIVSTAGNSTSRIKTASKAADQLIGSVEDIAERLGGGIDASRGSVSIGIRDKNIRVDTSGRGNTKTKKGAIDFGDDEGAAIEFAIRDLISDGVITGISQASQNVLRAGRNLQSAIEKAALIESIPRRLLQKTDPARYAVEELNREFTKMIAALTEGGATAAQFADAQKLYELERADAIKQATAEAGDAISDFLKDLQGGSSSPLGRRTVYGNAKTELDKFTADIMGGRAVDQQDLLNAARNFQDASRELYGSSKSFFDDFNFLFELLAKARDNAGLGTNVTNLPPSPFAGDVAVQNAIQAANNNQVAAITDQTAVLSNDLAALRQDVAGLAGALLGSRGGGASAFIGLPMFREK